MKTKICNKCKIETSIDNFSKRSDNIDGYRNDCNDCRRKYYEENRDHIIERNKNYQKVNRKKSSEYQKKWREENKEYLKEFDSNRKREKRNNDPFFKFVSNIRGLIYHALHDKGYTKKSHTYEILGLSFEELKNYLFDRAKLRYPNFKPEDFLKNNKYHIDHIKPLVTAKTEEEVLKLNHYTNLQLLTKEDNLIKYDSLTWK